MYIDDTIAAVSTPHGRGGIAVIRVSGSGAISCAERVFSPFNGKALSEVPDRYAVYGRIFDGEECIDDGLATVFRAPSSYTGEDIVEISCHGGILLTRTVLGAVFAAGARQAGPGEFTRRAFVNGKLSLTEAEAVIGAIDAESRAALRLHNSHKAGVLSGRIEKISAEIMHLLSSVYAYIDFPDEDMTDVPVDEMKMRLTRIKNGLDELCATYRTGHAVAEGILTVIAGAPNAGKSSLLNLLLGKQRAIVTDIEGTTRDTIEETAFAGDVMLRLCDTAGIRESSDTVEKIGVERSLSMLKEAQLILALFDGSRELTPSDKAFAESLRESEGEKLILITKADRGCVVGNDELCSLTGTDISRILNISCLPESDSDRERLSQTINAMFTDGSLNYDSDAVLVNARQYAAVKRAAEGIASALDSLNASMTQDIAGLDMESALAALGEADGREITDEIVDSIFHNFCVGK